MKPSKFAPLRRSQVLWRIYTLERRLMGPITSKDEKLVRVERRELFAELARKDAVLFRDFLARGGRLNDKTLEEIKENASLYDR